MKHAGTGHSQHRMTGAAHTTTLMIAVMGVLFFAGTTYSAPLVKSGQSSNSITLSWTAPGDDGSSGTASIYDIRYSTSSISDANWTSATQASGEPIPLPAGTAQSFEVTGLQENTTYYFAIKAGDEVPNWSELSNVVVASTDPESTPPSDVTNLWVGNNGPTSLWLYWTAPGDDGASGTATQYDIRYSTSNITDANFSSATPIPNIPTPQPGGSGEGVQVTGLNPSTTYFFALKTADEVPNWSGLSNVATGATGSETDAPADIANLAVDASTPTSVTLTWTAPGDDGISGTASQYDVRYSTSLITGSNFANATPATGEPNPQVAGSSETFTMTGLESSTTYYFAVKTADEVPNWSGVSNVVNTTTGVETTPPADVVNLAAADISETSIRLTWTAPGDDGASGTAAQYDIRYSTSPIDADNFESALPVADIPAPQAAGSTESVVVGDLASATTYYFAMKTADEVPNWSGISNIVVQSTGADETPPSAIDDFQAWLEPATGSRSYRWSLLHDSEAPLRRVGLNS